MKKVRYAVVGAGWISQEGFLPGVWQTENSVVSAIVTGSEKKEEDSLSSIKSLMCGRI